MNKPNITILGVGCLLLTDEGFGVHVVQKLQQEYDFPDNVSVLDGGVLGMNLLGVISEADYLIVIDIIRNHGRPGTIYRIDDKDIPRRIRAKNSLHQVDFLETMALCKHGLDKVPKAVIFGVEPEDMETYSVELTPTIHAQIDNIIEKVLEELVRLGGMYTKKGINQNVSCNSL